MIPLALAALLWVAAHVGIAGSRLRGALVARTGEAGFRGGYSVLSLLLFVALVAAYRRAPSVPLWTAPAWLGWLLVAAMLPACVLFVGSVMVPNPTAAGGEQVTEARGIIQVTRHPMLWSFAIWSGVHVLGNGELGATLFFGAFLLTAVLGMPSIDAKLAARDPARWAQVAARTSLLPRLSALGAVGWRAPLAGLVLWVVLIGGHPHVVGVSPLPAAAAVP